MKEIILPQNILEKEQYSALASAQKAEYIHNLLKEILELNPLGVNVSQISQATYFGRTTIWHHLEVLASRADCLKIEHGDTEVFHLNKVIAPFKEHDINDEYYTYWFHLVENTLGKFLRIQARQQDKGGSVVAHSGVIVNNKHIDKIIDSIKKIKEHQLNDNKPSEQQ